MSCNIISVTNQKGGVGKTTTCLNLGIGLAKKGQRVLLVDSDPQSSLTVSLGVLQPDQLPFTLATCLTKVLEDRKITSDEGILHTAEGIDLVPSCISLSGLEISLVNAMSRENILKQYIDQIKDPYDYVLIDCMPSLGMLTINALAASDSIIIPVQPDFLSIKGLEQLLMTIRKVKRQINPNFKIDGILLTMVDKRTNFSKDIISLLHESYGGKINIFNSEIPRSIKVAEASAAGVSILKYDPTGKASTAYETFAQEVVALERNRSKNQTDPIR